MTQADFAISEDVAMRISGMSRSRDGYVAMLDYGVTHPGSNVLPTSGGKAKLGTLGGTSYVGGRVSLLWAPVSNFEAFISADYTKESSEAGALVTRFAGNAATDANGNPWLVGADGTGIPFDCRFVPWTQLAFATSCDPGVPGYDPRYITYADFLDGKPPRMVRSMVEKFIPSMPFASYLFSRWGQITGTPENCRRLRLRKGAERCALGQPPGDNCRALRARTTAAPSARTKAGGSAPGPRTTAD